MAGSSLLRVCLRRFAAPGRPVAMPGRRCDRQDRPHDASRGEKIGEDGIGSGAPAEDARTWPRRFQGFLKFHRGLSLVGSSLASVAVLRPTAVRTMGTLEPGIDLGMMR